MSHEEDSPGFIYFARRYRKGKQNPNIINRWNKLPPAQRDHYEHLAQNPLPIHKVSRPFILRPILPSPPPSTPSPPPSSPLSSSTPEEEDEDTPPPLSFVVQKPAITRIPEPHQSVLEFWSALSDTDRMYLLLRSIKTQAP